jgi:glycosyltransferase involved in cell wall biosynthesis
MLTDQEITVVIPTYFNLMDFKLTFNGVLSQSKTPKEIIIIDSSEDLLIQQFLEEETHTKSIEIIYLRQVKKLFPGAARNLGVSIASSRWIAFLDTKTIPDSNWLKSSLKKAISSKADVVFGKTKYKASTSFQFYLIGSTYGYYPIVTVPGTLISKNKFQETNGFNSIVRSGEDIEWKKEVSEKFYTTEIDDRESLSYSSLPRTLYKTLKKFFIYQMHGASADIQINARSLFFAIFLILITLIIPRWNSFLIGWDEHPLYIPNITKIYILSITFFATVLLLLNRSVFSKLRSSPIARAIKLSIFILLLTVALRWNYIFAGFVESSSMYIPHITKTFISIIIFGTIFYRGIFFPCSHGISCKEVFPFRWVKIGVLGLLLDLVKAPGYLIGAIWRILKF